MHQNVHIQIVTVELLITVKSEKMTDLLVTNGKPFANTIE